MQRWRISLYYRFLVGLSHQETCTTFMATADVRMNEAGIKGFLTHDLALLFVFTGVLASPSLTSTKPSNITSPKTCDRPRALPNSWRPALRLCA
jgi:hypothetical protein